MLTKEKIKQILTERFAPVSLAVTDDSHQHAGHNPEAAGGGTHFSVVIVSPVFAGKKLVERHRMIYAVLEEGFKARLHALAIKASSPDEL
jgi:BolA family transcriptional regulator, general stress-responsive regulator